VASPEKKPALVGRSPLRAVVLAVVLERPGHGYQIAAYLRWRLGPSWRIYAKHLYPVLEALEESGLVWSEDVPAKARNGGIQSDKDRKMYYPTPAAEPARADWIRAPISLGLMRPDIHARLIFSRPDEAPLLLEVLDEYEREVIEAVEANARAEGAPVSWQGRMMNHTRAALGRQFDAEKESISEIRADIEKFLESR
jgi:DNA-binding PadR family transcriptional regulator